MRMQWAITCQVFVIVPGRGDTRKNEDVFGNSSWRCQMDGKQRAGLQAWGHCISVLCYCHKLPHTWWCKATEIYSHSFGGWKFKTSFSRPSLRCWQGHTPSSLWRLLGRICSLPLQLLLKKRMLLAFLGLRLHHSNLYLCLHITAFSVGVCRIFLCPSLRGMLVIAFRTHLGNTDNLPS